VTPRLAGQAAVSSNRNLLLGPKRALFYTHPDFADGAMIFIWSSYQSCRQQGFHQLQSGCWA